MKLVNHAILLILVLISCTGCKKQNSPAAEDTVQISAKSLIDGTLKVSAENPRYFTDRSGKAIYLTGSHTWENFQDIGVKGEKLFDYDEYLAMMHKYGHNFMRLWMFEQSEMGSWSADTIYFDPLPFERTGPGIANDGKPKFDLTKFNPRYFERLRERIIQAGEKNIYAAIMLFNGWSLDRSGFKIGDPYPFLPYNIANNINGISAPETINDFVNKPNLHSLKISPELLAVQEAYVKKVIETVNDLDNVLYEIINEGGATDWQYHMIRFIKETESKMPKQHPVGMTHLGESKLNINQALFDSPADWISPNWENITWTSGDSTITSSFRDNPPVVDVKKVMVPDTDHLWGHGGNYKWVWKCFLRGSNPILMDPWDPLAGGEIESKTTGWIYIKGGITKDDRDFPEFELIRQSMGQTRSFSLRVDLAHMLPRSELSSTGYCLANEGNEYLIYFPESVEGKIDLRKASGEFEGEWFIPLMDRTVKIPRALSGGGYLEVEPPSSIDAVLYLKKK